MTAEAGSRCGRRRTLRDNGGNSRWWWWCRCPNPGIVVPRSPARLCKNRVSRRGRRGRPPPAKTNSRPRSCWRWCWCWCWVPRDHMSRRRWPSEVAAALLLLLLLSSCAAAESSSGGPGIMAASLLKHRRLLLPSPPIPPPVLPMLATPLTLPIPPLLPTDMLGGAGRFAGVNSLRALVVRTSGISGWWCCCRDVRSIESDRPGPGSTAKPEAEAMFGAATAETGASSFSSFSSYSCPCSSRCCCE